MWQAGATHRCGARASHCGGLLWSTGSRRVCFSSCGSRGLERRLSSSGTRPQLLRGMWGLPGPGLEPVFPELAGGFLTTAPPGKSLSTSIYSLNDEDYNLKLLASFPCYWAAGLPSDCSWNVVDFPHFEESRDHFVEPVMDLCWLLCICIVFSQ